MCWVCLLLGCFVCCGLLVLIGILCLVFYYCIGLLRYFGLLVIMVFGGCILLGVLFIIWLLFGCCFGVFVLSMCECWCLVEYEVL